MNSFLQNKKTIFSILIGCTLYFLFSCDDIFVEDISDQTVTLQAPGQGLETTNNHIKFRWSAVTDATSYQLEVVSPDFTNESQLVFNLQTDTTAYDTILQAGQYSWKVKAANSGYSTSYFSSSFSIHPPFNITTQNVHLKSPDDQARYQTGEITFQWDSVKAASYYNLKIKENNWSGDSLLSVNVYATNYKFKLTDGIFSWGVAAIDTTTDKKTDYATRTLTIDQTSPYAPLLLLPASGDTLQNALINMAWSQSEENLNYQLEIYADPSLENIIINQQLTDTSTYVTINKEGAYFWRVKASDQAGNISSFSPTSLFRVVFETDISAQTVQLISPANGVTSNNNDITLWWQEVEGAKQYRIQVISPSFETPQQFITDQLTDSCSLSLSLKAGDYQWRVKAINKKYETLYTSSSFSIYGTDLTDKTVSLIQPLYSTLTNASPVLFGWEKINDNAEYTILIKTNSWDGSIVHQSTTSATNTEINLMDGSYVWGVKASDPLNGSSTEYSTRPLTVDLTQPEPPQLVSPANDITTEELLINFVWNTIDANNADLNYTLEIYRIVSSSDLPLTSKTTKQNSINYNFTEVGKYKWRIYASDQAGNKSDYSEFHFFEIKAVNHLKDHFVSLVAPAENLTTTLTSITFGWEAIPEAETYKFQLVKGTFATPESLIKSTEQSQTEIQESNLSSGIYQWRVKAMNTTEETAYTTRTLTITE